MIGPHRDNVRFILSLKNHLYLFLICQRHSFKLGLDYHIICSWKASWIGFGFLWLWEPYLPPSALPWDFRERLRKGNPDTESKCHYFLTGVYDVQFQQYANCHLMFSICQTIDLYVTVIFFSFSVCGCWKWLPSVVSYSSLKDGSNPVLSAISNLTFPELLLSLVSHSSSVLK